MSSFSDRHFNVCETHIYALLEDDIKEFVDQDEYESILKELVESDLSLGEINYFMEHTLPRVLRINKVGIELVHELGRVINEYENKLK